MRRKFLLYWPRQKHRLYFVRRQGTSGIVKFSAHWMPVAQEGGQWQALVTIISFLVQQKAWNFFMGLASNSISKQTLLHLVPEIL
jgi:hypothetical protein